MFVKLGMVGIYKKEIGLGGPDGSSPSGMSMKKLFYFKQYLKQRPVILSDNMVTV